MFYGDREYGNISVEYGPGENDYTAIEETKDPIFLTVKTKTEWREINPYDSYSILKEETYRESGNKPNVLANYESVTNDAYGYPIERISRNENNGVITSFYK